MPLSEFLYKLDLLAWRISLELVRAASDDTREEA